LVQENTAGKRREEEDKKYSEKNKYEKRTMCYRKLSDEEYSGRIRGRICESLPSGCLWLIARMNWETQILKCFAIG
ncbi:hypothetical protein AVEN_35252-2-1, partial [Araneus ventricosus]